MRNESVIQRACEIWWDRRSGAHRVNGFMEFIQEHDEDWYEDCKNLYQREALESYAHESLLEWADDNGVELADREDEDAVREAVLESDPANECAEVYGWYMLDPWVAARFADLGEVIYDGVDGPVWGRQCTGQSITLDRLVQDIVREYGEWAVREAGGDPAEVWG